MDTTLSDPLVGQLLDGRYAVSARIARGGMATVYSALDTRLDRTVAIKVMHGVYAEDAEFVARFHREAKAAARLSHPNVVAVYDQGQDAGCVYLAMEYVPGRTLRDLLGERGRLPAGPALALLEPVLAALSAAHSAGLVHRDVKPENVLLADDGRVKVADFGLARAAASTATTSNVLIGTVAYLAPEQVERGTADSRSDVYAAGTLLFEMLTGRPPYDGESPITVAYHHVHSDVPAPSTLVPGLPAAVDALVAGATQRDPKARYADAAEFLAAARRARGELPDSSDDSHPTVVVKRERRDTLVVRQPRFGPADAAGTGSDTGAGTDAATGEEAGGAAGSSSRPSRHHRPSWVKVLVVVLATLAVGTVAWWVAAGRFTTAPRLLVLDRTAAIRVAGESGLRVREGAPAYSETVAKGVVAAQTPRPGGRVPRSGTVTIRLSLGKERYAVPDVAGAPLDAARRTLTDRRLVVGTLNYDYSDSIAEGRIVTVDPKPRTLLKRDAVVTLVVSKGPQPVAVPDFTGEDVASATPRLTALGVRVANTEAFSETVPVGTVMKQQPGAGTIRRGDVVRLVVSKGPERIPVPDVVGTSVERAFAVLRAAGLVPRLGVDIPGGPDEVLRQSPAPGSTEKRGTTVTLYTF